jgi:hypothetical protein
VEPGAFVWLGVSAIGGEPWLILLLRMSVLLHKLRFLRKFGKLSHCLCCDVLALFQPS